MIAEAVARRPKIVLPGWRLATESEDGQAWVHRDGLRSLIWSVERHSDKRLWLHVSVAHRDRLPRWSELVEAKEWIAGTDSYAYQVIPPRSMLREPAPERPPCVRPARGQAAAAGLHRRVGDAVRGYFMRAAGEVPGYDVGLHPDAHLGIPRSRRNVP